MTAKERDELKEIQSLLDLVRVDDADFDKACDKLNEMIKRPVIEGSFNNNVNSKIMIGGVEYNG